MEINDVIRELKEENKACFKDCDGICRQIENGACTCRNAETAAMLEELNAYRKIGTVEELRQELLKEAKKMPKTYEKLYEEINSSFSQARAEMDEQTDSAFASMLFSAFETEGFAKRYYSITDETRDRHNQPFRIVRRCTNEDFVEPHSLPAWMVQFEDGFIMYAYPEEVIPSQIAWAKNMDAAATLYYASRRRD